jgi:DNA (cytosine-5)-methyltransferase 1
MAATSEFRFIDLFAGIGGFHHALSDPSFGGECVLACEINEECRRVYQATFRDLPADRLVDDVRKITQGVDGSDRPLEEIAGAVPDHEVLCAGFPCQPFSKSGFQMGVRDQTRGTLFFDIMSIVLAKRPRFLIMENVRNLAGPRHRATWTTITDSLRGAGYRVSEEPVVFSPHLLPPELGGAPQVRDRVFVLAEYVGEGASILELATPPLVERRPIDGWNPDSWTIERMLDPDEDVRAIDRYRLRADEQAWLDAWQAFVQAIPDDHLPGFPIWVDAFVQEPSISTETPKWKADFLRRNSEFYLQHRPIINRWMREEWGPHRVTVADFPPSRRKFEWQARKAQPSRADRDIWQLVMHLRPSGIRVKPPTYLPALVAITQTSVIGSRRRRITPREGARLQGIPDDVFDRAEVDDTTAYRQLGNAVNVGAVQWVARALFASAGTSWGSEVGSGKRQPAA